jgi:Immunity protein 49
MKAIARHVIDQELAEEGVEREKGVLESVLQSAATRPPALNQVLRTAHSYAGYLTAAGGDAELLCAALKTGARAADSLFALASERGEVEVNLGTRRVRLQATGSTDVTHAGNWQVGWWIAHIVCDRPAIDVLRATPLEILRRSRTRGDECQYLFVDALQALESRTADWSKRLQQAVDATDPEKAPLSDEEFVLNILVPQMELLFRFVKGEIAPFNETLQFALERHKKYWSKASRKRDPDGFIALGPLAIAAKARKAGMPIEVESDYLPKPVLEGRCCE